MCNEKCGIQGKALDTAFFCSDINQWNLSHFSGIMNSKPSHVDWAKRISNIFEKLEQNSRFRAHILWRARNQTMGGEHMSAKKGTADFLVFLPQKIIVIPQDSNLSWLTLFYALPGELVEKRPVYLELPQNHIPFCARTTMTSS